MPWLGRFRFRSSLAAWRSRRHGAGLRGAMRLCGFIPYELSYYNELVGGPRGAWERGFELTYWYDAFTDR